MSILSIVEILKLCKNKNKNLSIVSHVVVECTILVTSRAYVCGFSLEMSYWVNYSGNYHIQCVRVEHDFEYP
jgi:hypothetical protein